MLTSKRDRHSKDVRLVDIRFILCATLILRQVKVYLTRSSEENG